MICTDFGWRERTALIAASLAIGIAVLMRVRMSVNSLCFFVESEAPFGFGLC
jgi:uncharacterized membrane protein